MKLRSKQIVLPVSWILSAVMLFHHLPGFAVENPQNDAVNVIKQTTTVSISKDPKLLSLSREFNAFPATKKVDLILRDIDVPSVLRILAKEGGKNIILDNSVQGFINADLKNVSLNDAMKVILTSQELEFRVENNTIFVASRPAMAKKGLNRKYIKAFKLNNANAVDIAKILEASIFNKGYTVNESSGLALQAVAAQPGQAPAAVGTSTGQSNLIAGKTIRGKVETLESGSGFNDASQLASEIKIQNRSASIQNIEVNNNDGSAIVIPDTRTNSILIAGLQEDIMLAQETINYLDKALPQVAIEVSLIELTKTDDNDLGLLYGSQSGSFAGGFNASTSDLGLGFGTAADQAGITLNTIRSVSSEFGVRLNSLIKTNKAKLLANPTVLALDGSESLVKITDQIVSRMTVTREAQTGAIINTPELSDIGIVLNILPKISEDGFVTIKVRPSITTLKGRVDVGAPGDGGYANLISTREVILQDARVKSGETLAIAGLIKETDIETISKIPFAGDLPVFGSLFRNKSMDHTKSELVILITPKIVDDIAYN
ncbi:MAG: hypothetical protein ACD_20C00346G0012 [uncultured bacterium]|nr:MAG: hypothetical protein ACD_20C00346G0012 [uncultured bacterium]HBH18440.1 hypothetical protein [Cyanobacteria bacterium UBA9579]